MKHLASEEGSLPVHRGGVEEEEVYIYFAEVQDIRFSKILVLIPLRRYDLYGLEPGRQPAVSPLQRLISVWIWFVSYCPIIKK